MSTRLWVEWGADESTPAKLYKMREGETTKTEITLPTGTKGTNTRPSYATMNGREYIIGTFGNALVYNEYEECTLAGIEAPENTVSLATSGSGSLTGIMIPYISFADIAEDGTVLAQSNWVKGIATEFASNASRVWSGIPSEGPDRASHVLGAVSVAGALPRLAWTRTIGTTSVTEGMTTPYLAKQPAVPNDGLGGIVQNRYPPPYTEFCAVYRRRIFYGGDPDIPYRLWYSELDEPEAVGKFNFFDMKDRETIRGLIVLNDTLVIFCERAIYELQGWTDGQDGVAPDMEVRKIITGIGTVSHHSLIDINDRIWFASEDGIRIYDGSPRMISTDIYTYYRDNLKANRDDYRRAIAVNHKFWQCYLLLIPGTTTFIYVGHYQPTDPATGGSGIQPFWSYDTMTRVTDSLAIVFNSDGSETLLYGGCDGYLRAEDEDDNDDDGDTAGKLTWLQTRHEMLGQLSADKGVGWDVTEVSSYLETENQTTTLEIFSGDESIADLTETATHDDVNTIPASASSGQQALTYFKHRVKGASGRGFTLVWQGTGLDKDWRWRGYGIVAGPGRARRRIST